MKQQYYKLPMDFSRLLENGGGELEKCTEIESIDQHIELLLTTCPGEHRFDPEYGCRIWELDFERIVSADHWQNLCAEYVKASVTKYEKRITNIAVSVTIKEVVREEMRENSMIRKRVDVTISGNHRATNEPCNFGYKLFLAPLSND